MLNNLLINKFIVYLFVYFQSFTYNLIIYMVIIQLYQLKIVKKRAYILAFLFASFIAMADALFSVYSSGGFTAYNKFIYVLIQLLTIIGLLLFIIFIRQVFATVWYRIYWWYTIIFIFISIANRLYYKMTLAHYIEIEALTSFINLQILLNYLLMIMLNICLGLLFTYVGKGTSLISTLNYLSKPSRYLMCFFSSLFIWNVKQYFFIDNRMHIFYEFFIYCMIYVIILLIVMEQSNKRLLMIENLLLNQQKQLLSWEFVDMQQREMRIHKFYHDIGNHINTIRILIEDGEIARAEEYMQSIVELYQGIGENVYCSNQIINAVLLQKRRLCEQNNIEFEALIQLPEKLPIKDLDIMSVYSELIDKVLKVCLAGGGNNPYLQIQSKMDQNYFELMVKTSFLDKNIPKTNKIGLEKRNIEESTHNLSETILAEIVERLKGEQYTCNDKYEYTVIIRIPMECS